MKQVFETFAPAIMASYHRDKESFWEAVLAPFMSDRSLLDLWKHRQVGLDLAAAFRGLDKEAMQVLREFSAPLDIDVTRWKSNRPSYFKDAYPIFAFLVIWMDEIGLTAPLARFPDVLRSAVFGVAGYGILDENVDSRAPSPVEILTAQALICEYEHLILDVFGVTPVNQGILQRMRSIFLAAEIREKASRGKSSPYTREKPEECGAKGAHVVTPFMLGLEQLGRAAQIEDYWRVFLLFGAAIQVIDDWTDLEKDLAVGHFSYVTLGEDGLKAGRDVRATARRLRADTDRVQTTFAVSQEMLNEARAILKGLADPVLARLVDITELRMNEYFQKYLKLDVTRKYAGLRSVN